MRPRSRQRVINILQISSLLLLTIGIVVGTYTISTKRTILQTKATPAGTGKIFFTIDKPLEPDTDFTLTVKVASSGLPIYGFQFQFYYNPEYIHVDRNVLTDVLKTYDPEKKLFRTVDVLEKDTKGMIKAYGVKLGEETVAGSELIDLMDFSMKVKKNVPKDAPITFEWVADEVKLSGEGNTKISTELQNGNFTIGQPVAQDQPSPSPVDLVQNPSPQITSEPATPSALIITPQAQSPTTPVVLNIALKFQGIAKRIEGKTAAKPVKVTLLSDSLQLLLSQTAPFTLDENGIWRGSVSFNAPASADYALFVKGPFHLQKKFCTQQPVADVKNEKVCDKGGLTLNPGSNDIDFTTSVLFTGDLPEEKTNTQDGILNSQDLSLVRNNLFNEDPTVIARGDVNLDGVINSIDYALLLQTLGYQTGQ